MRNLNFSLAASLCFLCLCILSACGPSTSKLQLDIEQLQTEISALRGLQAEQTAQAAVVQQDLRQLVGRLDEMEHQQRAQLGTGLRDVQRDLSRLTARVPPPPIVPNEELSTDETLVSKLDPSLGERFNKGLQHLRLGEFTEALPLLEESAELSYGSENWPTMQFWVGITKEGMGNTRGALEDFHKLVEANPQHPRSRLALLRQASILIRMSDSATAKIILQKIVTDYPGTTESAKAKERLKDF